MTLITNSFKEQWPYFKADPIRWVIRWLRNWRNRPKLQTYLDWRAQEYGLSRMPGEGDEEFRKRFVDRIIWDSIEKAGGKVYDITRRPGESNEELKARINSMDIFEETL